MLPPFAPVVPDSERHQGKAHNQESRCHHVGQDAYVRTGMFRTQIDKKEKEKVAKGHNRQCHADEGDWIAQPLPEPGKSISVPRGGLETINRHATPSVLVSITAYDIDNGLLSPLWILRSSRSCIGIGNSTILPPSVVSCEARRPRRQHAPRRKRCRQGLRHPRKPRLTAVWLQRALPRGEFRNRVRAPHDNVRTTSCRPTTPSSWDRRRGRRKPGRNARRRSPE